MILASTNGPTTLLLLLLAGDVTLSVAVALLAWRGLSVPDRPVSDAPERIGTGAEGVAVSDLDPAGIVRVQGEDWSAVAVNAPVRQGSAVQVVGRGGVRLEVWGEEELPAFGADAAEDSEKDT